MTSSAKKTITTTVSEPRIVNGSPLNSVASCDNFRDDLRPRGLFEALPRRGLFV